MPNIKSAKKRVKVIATKTLRNKSYNSALKTAVKKADLAIEAGAADKTEAVRSRKSTRPPLRVFCIRIQLPEKSPPLLAS